MELINEKERNADFFQICELIRKNSKEYISAEDIVREAIKMEAKSFYIEKNTCSIIIYKVKAGILNDMKNKVKVGMYAEIFKKYIAIKRKNPDYTTSEIAGIIAEQKAPKFYMSERYALNLYYKLLKSKL